MTRLLALHEPGQPDPSQFDAVALAPQLPEVAIAGRLYPSGAQGEPIAGDFFDAFVLDDARTLIVIGDVVGHGVEAGDRRATLCADNRALALEGRSVSTIMRRLDVLQCDRGHEELATLWLGIYNRTADWLQYASAGHPPPVLAGVGGRTRLLAEASAPPLGTGHVAQHLVVEGARFPPGALLLAYSDGLIERAELDIEDQMEMLRAIVQDLYVQTLDQGALEHLVERIVRRLPSHPLSAPDDACVLAVHRPLGRSGGEAAQV